MVLVSFFLSAARIGKERLPDIPQCKTKKVCISILLLLLKYLAPVIQANSRGDREVQVNRDESDI